MGATSRGCYLVVPKSKVARKRFVGKARINSLSGKLYSVPLGFWGEDFKKPQEVLKKWEEMKLWGKSNNHDLRKYGKQIDLVKSDKTFKEVVDLFIQHKSHLQKLTPIKLLEIDLTEFFRDCLKIF